VRPAFKTGLFALSAICVAVPLFAGIVSMSALKVVEQFTDAQFKVEPWEMLGDTRGSYLPGYGAVFTFEMSLVHAPMIWPFQMTITPEEKNSIHNRKLKQLPVLKQSMRDLIVKSASTLTTLPASENIVFEAHLLSQPYEEQEGLPWRLTMTAQRQKVLDAVQHRASPADFAAIIEERKE